MIVDKRVIALQRLSGPIALLVIGYGLILALASHSGFPASLHTDFRMPFLADKPVGEDGFYMLTVAWNLARGEGMTYSSGEVTAGVQPLVTLVYAAAARIVQWTGGDKWSFVRVVILLGVVTLAALAFTLGRIAQTISKSRQPPVTDGAIAVTASVLTLTSFHAFRVCTYGLETGLYLVAFAVTTLFVVKLNGAAPGWRNAIRLGLLIGLTTLTRIDFAVVATAASLPAFLLARKWRKALVIAGGTALCIVAPWFWWVHAVSGAWMPSSGAAQMGWDPSWARAFTMLVAVTQQLAPWAYSGGRVLPFAAQAMSILILVLVGRRWGKSLRPELPGQAGSRTFWQLASATFVLVPVYFGAFGVGHFYSRYTSPLLVFSVPFVSVVVTGVIGSCRRAQIGLISCLLGFFAIQAYVSLHQGRVGNSHALAAGYVHTLDRGVKVGAFQSGVLGYFNDKVFNLDGKISRRALEAGRSGEMGSYIESEGIAMLIGWPEEIASLQEMSAELGRWRTCSFPVPQTHRCVERPAGSRP